MEARRRPKGLEGSGSGRWGTEKGEIELVGLVVDLDLMDGLD